MEGAGNAGEARGSGSGAQPGGNVEYGIIPVGVLLQLSPQRVRQLWLSASRDSASRLQELRSLAGQAGITVVEADDAQLDELADGERMWLDSWFMERVFPVLTPLAIDPAHPFPFIPNTGFSLALELERVTDKRTLKALLPICLLYTSDAADERSSVDLGGRRIIKKKKTTPHRYHRHTQ